MQSTIFFNSGPKTSHTTYNSLEFYSGTNQAYKAMSLQGSDGHAVSHIGFHNDRDLSLKDNVENVNINDCYRLLKNVNTKNILGMILTVKLELVLLLKISKQTQMMNGQT